MNCFSVALTNIYSITNLKLRSCTLCISVASVTSVNKLGFEKKIPKLTSAENAVPIYCILSRKTGLASFANKILTAPSTINTVV